jgi:hypothetical protein
VELVVRVLLGAASFAVIRTLVKHWPRLILARGPIPVAVVAVAAATGAAVAPGEPTAIAVVDTVLKAALGAIVVAASARARRQIWLFASTATVIAGVGASFDWLAFVATGAVLALLAVNRRSWVVGAFVGGCLTQVLLRLDLGGTTGTSAAVAGGVFALLIVSGLGRCRRSTQRRSWVAAGVIAGAAVLTSAAGALAAAGAVSDVRAGIASGKEALGAARDGEVGAATDHFDQAADAFGRASTGLDRWWARPALAVPVVSQQLETVRRLSRSGENLAGAASAAASELDLKGLRLQHGAVDLTALGRASATLASARRALDRAAREVEHATSPWLVGPLQDAVDDLGSRMADARRDIGSAAEVLDVAAPMLGRDGPRRWYVAVVTPAENRGSGGLVGNTGEITATAGRLALVDVQRVAQLNAAVPDDAAANVLPSIYAEAYPQWNVPARLQNVTVAADFPTAAEALEAVQPLAGRGDVDGTISLDPLAVAALLDVVGPVNVPSWPVPISARNASSVLLHEQYVALAEGSRENFLGDVIAAVWARATSGDLPSPAALARALGPVVQGRHIQLHSRRPDEQAALERLGAAGVPGHSGGDHLSLVTDNASQSKIDWFLHRAVDYRVRYDPASGLSEATALVTLTNDAPATGLPPYVIGGGVAPPGVSRQIVQLYTPLDLISLTVDGNTPSAGAVRAIGRSGNWAHEVDVAVPPKSTVRIEFRLRGSVVGPRGPWTLDIGHQPAVRPDDFTVTLETAGDWRIDSTGGGLSASGSTGSARMQIARDARIRARMRRR